MTTTRLPILLLSLALAACGAPPAEEVAEPAPEPAPATATPEPVPAVASATLAGREGSGISGVVTFTQEGDTVHVNAEIAGAPPGTHGFHIHEVGDCSAEDFTSAGGHFNPTGVEHGGPDAAVHHAGDLGNIEIGEDGSGELHLASTAITVEDGPVSVVSRGVILHADADDLTSQPTGAAGARLACSVIGAGEPADAAGGEPMDDADMGDADMESAGDEG